MNTQTAATGSWTASDGQSYPSAHEGHEADAPAGWYEAPEDPAGQMRYFDGTAWTEHVVQPGATAPKNEGDTPKSRVGARWSTPKVAIIAIVVLLIAVGAEQLVFKSAVSRFVGPGAAHLEAGQALDALPAADVLTDISGIHGPVIRQALHNTPNSATSGGSCALGTTSSSGFGGGASVSMTTSADASVEVQVMVFDTDASAEKAYRDMQRNAARAKGCLKAMVGDDNEVSDGEANGGFYLSINGKTADEGYGSAVAPTGNAVVTVEISNPAERLSADELTDLEAKALDAARLPDSGRQ